MSESASPTVAKRIRVSGRVQGVWYRGWTIDAATSLGLRGWVRNRRDGTVEALVIGPAARIDALIERCRLGPSAARVIDVAVAPAEDDGSVGFRQAPTE